MGYGRTTTYKNIAKEKLKTHLEDDFLDVQEDTSLENLTMIF